MCGLAGFVRFGEPAEQTKALLASMGEAMLHRGPDAGGLWWDDQMALVHRRLSILDLSTAGSQPMHSPCGRYVMVFNGEIYNFQTLRDELIAAGEAFVSHTDSEVLLRLYMLHGPACLQQLNGMFAIAIWDTQQQKLFLARDRLGKKPLYLYQDGNDFAFGSELKALMPLPFFKRELNPQALQDFFFYQYVPDPKSIFKYARKLKPGHYLEWQQGQISEHCYWDLSFASTSAASEEELSHQLRELLDDAVKIRMISDVPLGAFLSGGVDSSAVVASMAKQSSQPVTTCAIGFDSKKFDEVQYAKQIAQQFGTDHHEFTVRANVTDSFLSISRYFDEPFADPSFVPTYFVAELARKQVTVALAGDGGDENFAGYSKYALDQTEQQLRQKLPAWLRQAAKPLAALAAKLPGTPARKAHTLLRTLSLNPGQGFFLTNAFFNPLLWPQLIKPELARELAGYDSATVTTDAYQAADTEDHLGRVLYTDFKTYLPGDILVKVDRMTMANSLEARAPLLDYRLVEFAATVPSRLKLHGRDKKYLLKQSQQGILSHDILYRKKMGFSVPLAEWLCRELKPIGDALLLAKAPGLAQFFVLPKVQQLWQQHQAGDHRYTQELWTFLVFEAWWQHYMEPAQSAPVSAEQRLGGSAA
ncbi:asparagine synthase (glutamine-hydrolyzing) [Alkalimonas sp.]|uniref:asparagine synthase (glutamine-hydrolyzing) n=1 Tax=Alkalimonas sp. TaxID=1872453 RepID=UPI00263A68AB|nr:asparagine synthase (glutamine-hydrolyzing) [Alkalimonas sp.]MCC5827184.1 asparagine synthase (glutamine-hydrolyzing) [Alkalimonas sp.]